MIVRNEARIIERCLRSVAGHIACWVIGDTGSTDETMRIITDFFAARNIPGELHQFPFLNFEQARNEALERARASPLAFDYILLTDADMELEVQDPEFRTGLTANGYTVKQQARISYWNTRLLRRGAKARYRGVTHEYVDVTGGTTRLAGCRFIDHAEGSSRSGKFARDIALLEADLQAHPNHERSWFYLAQSFKDTKKWEPAANAYRRRMELGGWVEEKWYAHMQLARCLLKQGDENGFVRTALAAWNERPHRAEPLYDLARFHRERSQHHAAILFAEAGMRIPWPEQDSLFIEDWVYDWSLREEYAISGYYAAAHRERAGVICNDLALSPKISQTARNLARHNLKFYARPLRQMLKSFEAARLPFQPPDGYRAMNPSIVRRGEELWMVQRTVNYELSKDGKYTTKNFEKVRTRNFFLQLDDALNIRNAAEILPPAGLASYGQILGFEDLRPFVWNGEFWATATLRDQNPEAWCEVALCRLAQEAGAIRLTDYRILRPAGEQRHEKNWMVAPMGEDICFIYSIAPTVILNAQAQTLSEQQVQWAGEHLRGSTQAIPFGSGWLAVSHEHVPAGKARHYTHRFLWFDRSRTLRRISMPFILQREGVEFAAGLAWHPDGKRLILSFGVADAESWLGTCDATELAAVLAVQSPNVAQSRA
jgi:glycosyltransferase involved in cell wall biosynthesis